MTDRTKELRATYEMARLVLEATDAAFDAARERLNETITTATWNAAYDAYAKAAYVDAAAAAALDAAKAALEAAEMEVQGE